MTGQLKAASGTVSAPGLTWSAELGSGWYRAGAADIRFSLSAADYFKLTSSNFTSYNRIRIEKALPALDIYETDAAADEKLWVLQSEAGDLVLRARDDAGSGGSNPMKFIRTATVTDEIELNATLLDLNLTNLEFDGLGIFTGVVSGTAAPIKFESGTPGYILRESDAASNEKMWRNYATTGELRFDVVDDAGAGPIIWLEVNRTGTVIDSIDLTATVVAVSGTLELGHATDTTLSRASAGQLAVEGVNVVMQGGNFELGHLTDTTLTRIAAGRMAVEGNEVPVMESGTYTGTATGLTTSPTGTVRYERIGNVVTIFLTGTLNGVSNTTAFTVTGSLPASCRPIRTMSGPCFYGAVINNSVDSGTIAIQVNSGSSTLTFLRDGSATGFTASGSKGLQSAITFTYILT
jgi:hypothetical protein